MLARQSRQMGETLDETRVGAAREDIVRRAGGPAAMSALLGRRGATDADLGFWVEDALLAADQIRYMRERIQPPESRDLDRRLAGGGGDEAADPERDALRRRILDEQTRGAIVDWLAGVLERGLLRIPR